MCPLLSPEPQIQHLLHGYTWKCAFTATEQHSKVVSWKERSNPRTGEIPSVTLSPGAVHQGQVKPHLPSFLLAPALFCFADGFFIYFGCCRELQGGKTRGIRDNPGGVTPQGL